jgi:hypothetical protein
VQVGRATSLQDPSEVLSQGVVLSWNASLRESALQEAIMATVLSSVQMND